MFYIHGSKFCYIFASETILYYVRNRFNVKKFKFQKDGVMENEKKIIKSSFATIIISCLMAAQTNANMEPMGTMQSDAFVSMKEVINAAYYHVLTDMHANNTSGWKNKHIKAGTPIPVYDATDTLTSYIVNLYKDGEPAGYVEISASKDEPAILSFSYDIQMSTNEMNKMYLQLEMKGKNKKSEKVVQISPGNFGVKVDYDDGTAEVVNRNYHALLLKEQNIPKPKHIHSIDPSSRNEWQKIDNQMTGAYDFTGNNNDGVTGDLSFESGPATTYYISNVPDYDQKYYPLVMNSTNPWTGYSGCAPTAASNVLYYWAYYKGKSGIVRSTWDQTISDLRSCMGTIMLSDGEGSTPVANISSGMKRYLSMSAHSDSSAYIYDYSNPSWSTVKSALLNNCPDIITFFNQDYYCKDGGHTVTGVGTIEYSSSGHKYMIIHDNWPNTPQDVYVVYGSHYSSLDVVKCVP
jgi:hypothetical protein